MGIQATHTSPVEASYVVSGAWEGQLIDAALAEAMAARPRQTALVDRGRRIDYARLGADVRRATTMLAGFGVSQGDVVSFQLPNWYEAAVVFYATVRLGAISNPIIPIYRGREVEFILRQARSRVFVVPDVFRRFDYRAMVADLRESLPDLEHLLVAGGADVGGATLADALQAADGEEHPPAERSSDDPVLLLYTSGTESRPKGVLHSHNTLVYECRSIIDLYELTDDDRVFMPSPVTHITGLLYGLMLPVLLGTTVVLQDIWDVALGLDLIERERLTFCVGATPFLHGLVHAADPDGRDLTSLRVFGCGGADIPPALIYAAHERLGVVASRLYGSTECPTATGTPLRAPLDRHATTDGRAIASTEVRVVDDDDHPLPPGTRGNLQVRGPDLCLGYLDSALNEPAFTADGWFRSGDLAAVDSEGSVTIAGRAKDVIVRGGENLSAKEIEDLLFEHPAVEEVAVVGLPDQVLGERVCAFVVAGDDAPPLAELVAFLRDRRVANQKLPERLELLDSLPKTASGKVQKYRLRARLRQAAAP